MGHQGPGKQVWRHGHHLYTVHKQNYRGTQKGRQSRSRCNKFKRRRRRSVCLVVHRHIEPLIGEDLAADKPPKRKRLISECCRLRHTNRGAPSNNNPILRSVTRRESWLTINNAVEPANVNKRWAISSLLFFFEISRSFLFLLFVSTPQNCRRERAH